MEQLFGPAPAPPSDSNTEATTAAFDLNILPPFEKFRVLHTDPMVLSIDDFFTNEECDKYVQMSIDADLSAGLINEEEAKKNCDDAKCGEKNFFVF